MLARFVALLNTKLSPSSIMVSLLPSIVPENTSPSEEVNRTVAGFTSSKVPESVSVPVSVVPTPKVMDKRKVLFKLRLTEPDKIENVPPSCPVSTTGSELPLTLWRT